MSSRSAFSPRFRRRRGFALLAVLWLTTLLALVAASFTTTARTGIQLGRNAAEKAKAEALADAGVHLAILALLESDPERRWRTDGTVYGFTFGGGEIRVSVQDEAGKLDLNTAADELLHGLLVIAAGLEEEQAAAVVDTVADFRDPDDLRRLNGAEDADYLAAGLPYGAKDAPFEAIEELQQVMGITPELYRRLAPFLTVHSWQPGIDPMAAPPEILLALPGVDPVRVEAFLTARADMAAGLDPETVTAAADGDPSQEERTVGTAQRIEGRRLSARERLSERRQRRAEQVKAARDPIGAADALLLGAEEYLASSDGSIFGVRAEGRSAGGGVFVREAVLVVGDSASGLSDQPYGFYSWRRGEAPAAPD